MPTSAGSLKKQEGSRKRSISALLTAKTFDCVDHNKLLKILKVNLSIKVTKQYPFNLKELSKVIKS